MSKIQIIDNILLDKLSKEAAETQRKRKNYNLHTDYSDPVNRMLNALEPDTYCQPHRHKDPDKDEIFLVLKGKIGFLIFDDKGNIIQKKVLSPSEGVFGVDITSGCWHTVVCMEKGSVAYDIKRGPYEKTLEKNFAPWAPKEGTKEAKEYLKKLKSVF